MKKPLLIMSILLGGLFVVGHREMRDRNADRGGVVRQNSAEGMSGISTASMKNPNRPLPENIENIASGSRNANIQSKDSGVSSQENMINDSTDAFTFNGTCTEVSSNVVPCE